MNEALLRGLEPVACTSLVKIAELSVAVVSTLMVMLHLPSASHGYGTARATLLSVVQTPQGKLGP